MIRSDSLILCVTFVAGFSACGSNGNGNGNVADTSTGVKDPLNLIPVDQTVPGWIVDQEHSKQPGTRAMTATSEIGTEALIDGGSEDYYREPYIPKMFLWQNYVNPTLPSEPEAKVRLYLFQMSSAEQAQGIYQAIMQRPSHSSGSGEWATPTPAIGSESRIQDTATQWWVNFHQDVYYGEILLFPSYGPEPDFNPADPDTQRDAIRFAQAIAAKI